MYVSILVLVDAALRQDTKKDLDRADKFQSLF